MQKSLQHFGLSTMVTGAMLKCIFFSADGHYEVTLMTKAIV